MYTLYNSNTFHNKPGTFKGVQELETPISQKRLQEILSDIIALEFPSGWITTILQYDLQIYEKSERTLRNSLQKGPCSTCPGNTANGSTAS